MRLVYKFYIPHTEQLDALCRMSNNLYNQALYLFRQRLDADGTWTWYNDMDKLMKSVTNLEGECNYKLLKSQCSQQVLRVLDKNIKAYSKSIKDWKKHPEKYKGMPQMPHYRKRGGLFNLYYTNQSASIKDGKIRLAKDLYVSIPQWEKCDALAFEEIGKHEKYAGRRIRRGLFRSSTGKLINADQNGALNIMRKVVGDSYVRKIVDSGHSLCPIRYRSPFQRIAGSMQKVE